MVVFDGAVSILTEIFKVVDEVGQLATLVDLLARAHNGLGERSRPAAEDADLADVAVLLLDELEEGRHVRTAEVVDRLEAGEHAVLGDALEVVLADVQHGGAQVELVEELRDEDVHLQHVGHVLALHVAQHVDEPLEVAMRRTRPQKVHLAQQFPQHLGLQYPIHLSDRCNVTNIQIHLCNLKKIKIYSYS